ncbi:hypothetical protein DACRYDRAFT_92406 [Dacryopinax primogenitus]|uniref:Uncharacterized protein n=1 Tax=Dacryopinax primogenitus (strain DJM 731) TaxID=1858805 RepID=M5G844_DACPD|nr:uncharacterized protein DACRYDRAFT_92406 [Dacryopinax primogenitus]EJU06386.1 hypothetical protein DACRYDRAFT_92406 [Dacryopinax primogenitus]
MPNVNVEAALAPFYSPLTERKPDLPAVLVSPRARVGPLNPPSEKGATVPRGERSLLGLEESLRGEREKLPLSVRLQETQSPGPKAPTLVPPTQESLVTASVKPAEPAAPVERKETPIEPHSLKRTFGPVASQRPTPVQPSPASEIKTTPRPAVPEPPKQTVPPTRTEEQPKIPPSLEVKTDVAAVPPFPSVEAALRPFVPLWSPHQAPLAVPLPEPVSAKSDRPASSAPISEKAKSPSPAAGGVEEGEVGEVTTDRLEERYDDDRDRDRPYRRSRSPDRRRTPYDDPGYDSRRYPSSPPRRPAYDEHRPRSPSYFGPSRSPPPNAPRSPRYGQRSPRWTPRDRSPPRGPRHPPPVSPVFQPHAGPSTPGYRAPPPGPSRGYPPSAPRAEHAFREGCEGTRAPPLGPRALYGQSPYGPPRAPFPPPFGGRGGGPPPMAPRGNFPPRPGWRGRGRGSFR